MSTPESYRLLPEGYRLLGDMERIEEGDFCFGKLDNGETGWGRPPPWLVGQAYLEGSVRHPKLIAREEQK